MKLKSPILSRPSKKQNYLIACMVGMLCTMPSYAASVERQWHPVRGKALQELFADRDFGDGVHFAYQFLGSGELHGMNMGKPAQGRWRVAGSQLCWRWMKTKDPEECYEVRQQGSVVRLFLDGQEVLSGNLTPLPPKPTEVTR